MKPEELAEELCKLENEIKALRSENAELKINSEYGSSYNLCLNHRNQMTVGLNLLRPSTNCYHRTILPPLN